MQWNSEFFHNKKKCVERRMVEGGERERPGVKDR